MGTQKTFSHVVMTRRIDDISSVFEWCFENLSHPAKWNHKPRYWHIVWRQYSKIVRNLAVNGEWTPRKELFRFKSEEDAVLFALRWR